MAKKLKSKLPDDELIAAKETKTSPEPAINMFTGLPILDETHTMPGSLGGKPVMPWMPMKGGPLDTSNSPYTSSPAGGYIPVQPYYNPDGTIVGGSYMYQDYWIDANGTKHPVNSSSPGCDCYSCQKNKMMLDPSDTHRKLRERAYETVTKYMRERDNRYGYRRYPSDGFSPEDMAFLLADFGMRSVTEAQQEMQAKVQYQSMQHAQEVQNLKRNIVQQALAKKPKAVPGTDGRLFRDGDEGAECQS